MDQETTNNIENDLNNLTSEGEVSELIGILNNILIIIFNNLS
jgi:hypothetical protein